MHMFVNTCISMPKALLCWLSKKINLVMSDFPEGRQNILTETIPRFTVAQNHNTINQN